MLRPENAFVVSLSNHERNYLKSHALRPFDKLTAQGERSINTIFETQH